MEREKTIGFRIRELHNVIRRHGEQHQKQLDHPNIPMMHRWIINYLADHVDQDIFQKDLEAALNIGKSTLTEILHLMEKHGLVIRVPSEKDARCKKLVLTERALDIHREILCDIEEFEQQLVKGISEEELEGFFALIGRMLENARQSSVSEERIEDEGIWRRRRSEKND